MIKIANKENDHISHESAVGLLLLLIISMG